MAVATETIAGGVIAAGLIALSMVSLYMLKVFGDDTTKLLTDFGEKAVDVVKKFDDDIATI